MRTARVVAKGAYEKVGIKNLRGEISLMEVHDGIFITELVTMEGLFVSAGRRATPSILKAFFDRQSQGIPCQVGGSLEYFGRPVGAGGLRAAYVIHTRLLGRADKRWLDAPCIGLLHNASGYAPFGRSRSAHFGPAYFS